MRIKKETKIVFLFGAALVIWVAGSLWQITAIKKNLDFVKAVLIRDLKSVKAEAALAKQYASEATASSEEGDRVGGETRLDELESKVNNLESKVMGGYGLESRVDRLESEVSNLD
jgi:hypothetical protein